MALEILKVYAQSFFIFIIFKFYALYHMVPISIIGMFLYGKIREQ